MIVGKNVYRNNIFLVKGKNYILSKYQYKMNRIRTIKNSPFKVEKYDFLFKLIIDNI